MACALICPNVLHLPKEDGGGCVREGLRGEAHGGVRGVAAGGYNLKANSAATTHLHETASYGGCAPRLALRNLADPTRFARSSGDGSRERYDQPGSAGFTAHR